jgi:low molecular weight protein-tyrosine phosphatase
MLMELARRCARERIVATACILLGMSVNQRIGVLFVCTGNICRSPTAEAVFRHHVESAGWSDVIAIASAGTHGYHIGDPPDIRAQDAGLRRRYDLSRLRARQVEARDFERFDYLLAMDRANLAELRRIAPRTLLSRAKLFLDFGSKGVQEVPDPYYGADEGFEHVLDLIEDASRGLLAHLQQCIGTHRRSSS